MARLTQMRIYTINKGEMETFLERWRTNVVPLRRQHGFSLEGAWVYGEANKFVWLMSHEGTLEDWQAADQAYMDSPERRNTLLAAWDCVAHNDETMLMSVLE